MDRVTNQYGVQEMRKPGYCALCCYFGKWPSTFQLWLDSCSWNPDFDFAVLTDIPTDGYRVPANVRIVTSSFDRVRDRMIEFACSAVGADRSRARRAFDKPYKCCDYKPLYGLIFPEIFSGYDYVGNCDIDLIWGRLSRFLPENQDCRYRKILPCGHLTYYRNDPATLNLYLRAEGLGLRGFKEVVETAEPCFFDEVGGMDDVYRAVAADSYFDQVVFDDLQWGIPELKSIHRMATVNKFYELSAKFGCVACWREGCRVVRREIAYVHFQKRKVKNLVPRSCAEGPWTFAGDRISEGPRAGLIRAAVYTRKRWLFRIVRRLRAVFSKFGGFR